MTLLVDLGDAPDECCTDAIEHLAKALSEGPGHDIWAPLENPWARAHCEAVTLRLQSILDQIQRATSRFLRGHGLLLFKAEQPWIRWDDARMAQVRARLESLGVERFELAEWLQLVELLIATYLPEGVISSEAEYIAVRSALMGKIQAAIEEPDRRPDDATLAALTRLVPTAFAAVPDRILSATEAAILRYSQAHAGEMLRGVTDGLRHRMATLAIAHTQATILGQREGGWRPLATALFDALSITGRDMRRIAVTEIGEAVNQGVVAALPPGRELKRIEAYRGACPFCASINGRIFRVVAPEAPDKDGDTEIWPGKTNAGRSASRRMRDGPYLVERPKSQMWWPAAGVQHPHCRGAWQPVSTIPPGVSPEFHAWLQDRLNAAERSVR